MIILNNIGLIVGANADKMTFYYEQKRKIIWGTSKLLKLMSSFLVPYSNEQLSYQSCNGFFNLCV